MQSPNLMHDTSDPTAQLYQRKYKHKQYIDRAKNQVDSAAACGKLCYCGK